MKTPAFEIGFSEISRLEVRPGDILVKLDDSGVISYAIKNLSHSGYVHGGIAGGNGDMYEVGGGLDHSERMFASIYRADLNSDKGSEEFHVWRCKNSRIAAIVSHEAPIFVSAGRAFKKGDMGFGLVGMGMGWGYNLTGALASANKKVWSFIGAARHSSGKELALLDRERNIVLNGGGFVTAAISGKRTFFCTEWIVWMYLMACAKAKESIDFDILPHEANPGKLAYAMDMSRDFARVGKLSRLQNN
ncbi:hypothetical protein [Burkholderia cepacia]|uniref:hypothetical protein n=1 Tax=Burkholderia cepacia TaxID=292 RepID=UPI000A659D63|nr:hypothetical protein [Burkholderia cepacia]